MRAVARLTRLRVPCSRARALVVGAHVALALALGTIGAGTAAAQPRPAAAAGAAADLSATLEAATRLAAPAVVEIFATGYAAADGAVPRAADLVTTQRASGSGVIVDPAGYVVTNAHVVRGALRLRVEVTLPTTGRSILARASRTLPARIVGLDAETDLAVVKLDGVGDLALAHLPFGDSDALRAGQLVLALGNPLGFQHSVSLGVVSAVARQLERESPMVYVQTDASINPGSSGGPLIDLDGRVVGINTLIASQHGGSEGLGFAAPANIVRAVYEQVRQSGRVRRGDIGIRAQTITPALAAGLRLSRDTGAILGDVRPGSAGDRAGLLPGDVVLALDGKPMENGRQLQIGLSRRRVGDIVSLSVLRDQPPARTVQVRVEDADPLESLHGGGDPREHLVPRLGILGVSLDAEVVELLPALRGSTGVVVLSTVTGAIDTPDGGLSVGDVIYTVNRRTVADLDDLRAAVDAARPGEAMVLQLERRGELVYLTFTAE